ncbi:transposase [Streptomyces violaceus]|uniref:transposase n=1 Tax=Streptomyces violaceus TaxID=1936 RepID=UPI00399D5C27
MPPQCRTPLTFASTRLQKCATSVHRRRRAHREQPGRRLPCILHFARTRGDRSGVASPRSWTEDEARCRATGIPDSVGLATKPASAAHMIDRALDSGVHASWAAGDEVYGSNPHLRTALEQRAARLHPRCRLRPTRSSPAQAGAGAVPARTCRLRVCAEMRCLCAGRRCLQGRSPGTVGRTSHAVDERTRRRRNGL